MRKLLLVLIAGLALILAGCTTGTNGDGQQEIDTQAFFPNDQNNYWQYEVDSDPAGYDETWTVIDDPDYLLAGQQRIRSHVDDNPDGTYLDSTIVDDETNSVELVGMEYYDEGSREWLYFFTSDPWTLLIWDDYGISVGDTWDAWNITGVPPDVFGFGGAPIDSLGFDLDAEVTATEDFQYSNDDTLTSYKIVFSGDIIFEIDGEDPDEWDHYEWQKDYYFVPEFGWVMIQIYEPGIFGVTATDFYTLTDTNVPIPD